MKTITVPYLPGLDMLSLNAAETEVLAHGTLVKINEVNWPDVMDGFPADFLDSRLFFIAWSDRGFYLTFSEDVAAMRGLNVAHQSAVSDDTCFEFFIKPSGTERYCNIEVNCHGAINCSRRTGRHDGVKLQADELAKFHVRTEVRDEEGREIALGRPLAENTGSGEWHLLLFVPFEILGVDAPEGGREFDVNFYACAAKAAVPYYFSWAPIESPKPDYHRPEFFGKLILDSKN